jgi:hypothetical protein
MHARKRKRRARGRPPVPRRARSLGVLSAGVAGTAALSVLFLSGEFLLELWRGHELDRLPPDEGWRVAARLEGGSALARRAAEDWYLEVFEGSGSKAEAPLRALARMRSTRAVPLVTFLLRKWLDGKGVAFPPVFLADRLREIGPEARRAKPELVELLWVCRKRMQRSAGRESWRECHQSAVVALESVLGEPGMAAGILRNELDHPIWVVRLNAVRELGELGPDAALALDGLTARLEDPQASVREQAATVLGSLGEAGLVALPALRKARDSGDESFEAIVEDAILRLESPELVSMDDDE